jgi:predicted AAA+ superfamily ATPase
LKVEKTEAFSSLIKLLAGQAGRLVNYSELSSTLGISLQTVKKHLWYGEKTFILERVSPFFRNVRKEKLTHTPAEIHFWRTKDWAEVDFVIQMGNRVIPVEVKFKELKQPEIGRSLRSFIQRYAPERAWVINLSLSKKTAVKDTKVEVLPFYEVIFKDWAALFGEHAATKK